MFCQECGQPISETAKFCKNCGVSISRAAPSRGAAVGPPRSDQEMPARRQLAVPTSGGSLLAAVAGLVGCGVTLAGLFTPWTKLGGSHSYSSGWPLVWHTDIVSESYSLWDWIGGAQGYNVQLEPHNHHWLVLIGALVGLVGMLAALALPRLKPTWAIALTGSAMTIVGVLWAFLDGYLVVSSQLLSPTVSRGYGMFLALAGSIVALVASLLGLAMLTDLYRRQSRS